VASRELLERELEKASKRFGESPPRPADWGGCRLTPERFEFWQGRKDRLHDRLRYRRAAGAWKIERLAP
jgi:pyridoxamine 5'-phosphate oxidase